LKISFHQRILNAPLDQVWNYRDDDVNMLQPGEAKTFLDYGNKVFLPYIQSQLQHVSRLDIAWDVYRPDNLKADVRDKIGKGIR